MTKYPVYRVFDEKGEQYADCGRERTAQNLILVNQYVQKLTYRRIDAPKPLNPETVDVGVIPTEELPGQQGLPRAVDRLPFEPEPEEELGLPQSEFIEF